MTHSEKASPLALIFFADAVAMTIEMVAARVLSPYFGSSNAVWTAVIGVILLASSIGNYYGGKLADKHPIDPMVRKLLWGTACWMLFVSVLGNQTAILLSQLIHIVEIGALVSSLLLFLSPAIALGMVTPMLMRKTLQNHENGTMTGRFYATMTAGGLTGTFIGGFILIPTIGCVQMMCAVALALCWMAFYSNSNAKSLFYTFCLTVFTLFLCYHLKLIEENSTNQLKNGLPHYQVTMDTKDGHVVIYNAMNIEGDSIRLMNVGGGYYSATYLNPEMKYELPFSYTRAYNHAVNCFNNTPNCLMIGGAGYSYPKYFISHFPDSKMDVVEIDPKITEIARKYFFLEDLEREFNTKVNKRLNIYHEDGRVFLTNTNSQYDIIMNDAFTGEIPIRQLATIEAAKTIKDRLNKGGVYATNIVLMPKNVAFARCEYYTLSKVFNHVYVIPVSGKDVKNQNLMVLASDRPLALSEDTVLIHHLPADVVFTDNFSPVERVASYAKYKDLSLSGAEQMTKQNILAE